MPKLDPTKAARTARDAIETLNHATITQPIPAPIISSTVQTLISLLGHLPQGLEQLGWALAERQRAEAIRMDDSNDPAAPVAEVTAALQDTVRHLIAAQAALQRAASPLFGMAAI